MRKFAREEVLFISDTHFGHKNIIEYSHRPYASVEQMDADLGQMWAQAHATGKTIIHLGDFIFNRGKKAPPAFPLYGAEKHKHILIVGNHDHWMEETSPAQWFGEVIGTVETWETNCLPIEVDGVRVLLSHNPQKDLQGCDLNFHGHIHTNPITEPGYDRCINCCVEVTRYAPATFTDLIMRELHD